MAFFFSLLFNYWLDYTYNIYIHSAETIREFKNSLALSDAIVVNELLLSLPITSIVVCPCSPNYLPLFTICDMERGNELLLWFPLQLRSKTTHQQSRVVLFIITHAISFRCFISIKHFHRVGHFTTIIVADINLASAD